MPAADPTEPTTDPRAVSMEPPEASTDPRRDRRVGNDSAAKLEDPISLMRTGRRLRPHSLKWRRRKEADLEGIEARRISRRRRKARRPKIGSRFPITRGTVDFDRILKRLLRRPSKRPRKADQHNRSAAEESSGPVPGRLLRRSSSPRRADLRNRSTVAAGADSVRISGPPRRASSPRPKEPRRNSARHLQAVGLRAVTAEAAAREATEEAASTVVTAARVAS